MGMFDDYVPVPELKCPVDGKTLTGWQGKAGPCSLNRYVQGEPMDPSDFPIHGHFELYANCYEVAAGGHRQYVHTSDGYGVIRDGTWSETHFVRVSRWNTETRTNDVLWERQP